MSLAALGGRQAVGGGDAGATSRRRSGGAWISGTADICIPRSSVTGGLERWGPRRQSGGAVGGFRWCVAEVSN